MNVPTHEQASLTVPTKKRPPLASPTMRIALWILFAAVVGIQARGVWDLCLRDQQLCDFGHFYYAAAAWRTADRSLYEPNFASLVDIDGQSFELRNVASPTWHLIVLPFTFASPSLAFCLWVACNIAAWIWSLRICQQQWTLTIDRRWYPVIALVVFGSTLTAGAFHTGQYVALLMLPATLAWRAARQDRWTSAGAWLGLLAYHKPFVLLFVIWLAWNRRWRALIAAGVVLAGSWLLGELVFGAGIHLEWRNALQRDVAGWTWLYVNASTWAPWARAFGPSPSFAHWLEPIVASSAALASAALVAAITGWVLRRRIQIDSAWTILWTAALLISPLGWTYYLWWGAGPFGAVVLRAWRERPHQRWQIGAIAACFWLPLHALVIGQPSVAASFLIGSLFTWALIAFWVLGLRDAKAASA